MVKTIQESDALNINDFWTHFKSLEKLSDSTTSDMKVLLTLFTNVRKAYENFSNTLRNLGENFHKEISKHYHTDERNFSYYHYLGNYLLKISETNKGFGKKIDSLVFTPYLDFAQTLDNSNRESVEKLYKILLNLESAKSLQKKHQDTYYKLSRTAEKIQESFGKMIDEGKTEDIILKAQDKMIKIKMEAQESGQTYRQQITTTNQWWKKLYADYKQTFKVYDENEDSKAYYNRNIIMRLVKLLEEFYLKGEDVKTDENLEDKFMQLDEKSVTKADTFQVLTLGKLDSHLQSHPEEEFVSYEAKRKMDEALVLKSMEEEEYSLISAAADEANKQFVTEYAKKFQHRKSIAATTNNTSANASVTSTNDQSIVSEDSTKDLIEHNKEEQKEQHKEQKEKDESPVQVVAQPETSSNTNTSEDAHKKMLDLVTNSPSRKIFIDILVKQRDPSKDLFEIKLPFKTYEQLQDILVKILKELVKENDFETLVQYLPLVNKYYTNKEGQTYFLYKYLRSKTLWEDPLLWSNIMRSLYEKRNYEENNRQKKYQEIEKNYSQPRLVSQLWSFGKQLTAALDLGRKVTVSENDLYSSVLHELGFYLSRLTKNLLVSSEILMRLAFEVGMEKEDIAEMILAQKREFDELVRERIKHYPHTKAKKAQTKWERFYPLRLSLDFLEPVDLVKLLTLDKKTRTLFKNKIYRTIFYNFGEKITSKQRFQIWFNILEVEQLNLDYKELLKEYKELPEDDKSVRSVEEVIQIDVARSFNKHPDCNPTLLRELLESYATYDKEVSYCQGMNYMMGFLHINTLDPERSFKCFVRIMERWMKGMFDNEFKMLKTYFFKFNRILELYAPDLAEHFKKEKVEPSYFIPSWFITVFSNAFQYARKSQLLEKIWDFYILDGMKVIFKTALLLMLNYKKELLDMRFDKILNFLGELGKEEIFTNTQYWKIRSGEIPVEQAHKDYSFIVNYGKSMKDLHLTKQLLKTFDNDYDVLENRMGRLLNPHKKK